MTYSSSLLFKFSCVAPQTSSSACMGQGYQQTYYAMAHVHRYVDLMAKEHGLHGKLNFSHPLSLSSEMTMHMVESS